MRGTALPSTASRETVPGVGAFRWLLLVALPVFFIYLGANSIWDANEAFYVETPRQMVESGDYITPTFNGQKRLNKPVLSYWIVAGLYRGFGESVAVERAGIAIGAMGIVFAAFLIGRALRSTATGILAALIVATAPRVVWFARRIFIDIYITMFMSLALACFVLAERQPAHRRRYLLLMYVAIALGVLTKGPVALALPALVCLAWLVLERRLGDLKRLHLLSGAVIVLSVVLPWYGALYARYGWTYIEMFVFNENLGRYTSSMTPESRGLWFYLPVLLGDLFPWAPLVIVPLVAVAVARWRQRSVAADPRAAIRRLVWLWIVVIVGVFSFSRTKEDLYIFPTVSAVAALVADTLFECFERRANPWLTWIVVVVSSLCVAIAPVLYWLFGPTAGYYSVPGSGEFAVVLAITGLVTLILWVRHRPARAVAALAAGFVALNYLFVGRVLPGVEQSKPAVPLARTVAARAAPDAKVGYFNMGLQSFVYYTDRRAIEEIQSIEQAQAFFSDRREAWVLMGPAEWQAVHARVPDTCVADRHPLSVFDAKFTDIVSRTPPLEALLVKNNCGG